MFRFVRFLCAIAAGISAVSTSVQACSVCSCGDPSTVACSREAVAETPAWAVAIESRHFSKSNSNDAGDGTESHSQTQIGLAISRTFRHGFEVYVRMPFVSSVLKTTGTSDEAGRINRSGAGDLDLLAKYSLRSLSSSWTPSLSVGVKAPTGNNDLKENGERMTEHAQPGTGSWDGYAVMSLSREGTVTWSGAAGYRFNGVNSFSQRYGQVGWLQLTASRPLFARLRLDAGMRLRSAATDLTDEGSDPNSGGTLLSGLLGARVSLTQALAFRISGAIPLAANLRGSQKEYSQIEGGLVTTF